MAAPPCKNVAFPFDSNDLIKTINPPFDREGSGFLGHTRDFLGRFLALKSEDGPKKSKQKCRCIRDGHRVIEDKVQMFSALSWNQASLRKSILQQPLIFDLLNIDNWNEQTSPM